MVRRVRAAERSPARTLKSGPIQSPGGQIAQRRRGAGRRHRDPGRAEHPQAADQDRGQADHRAHHRRDAAVAADRRDRGDDGARLPRRGAGDRPAGRLRQGQPDPGGRRHPERHHGGGAGRARRRGVQRPAARRGPPAGLPDDHRRQRRGAADLRGGGHRHPVRRHGHPGRPGRRQHDRRAPPAPAAPRPDPAVLPAVDDPRRVREGRPGPQLHRHRRLHRRAALPAGGLRSPWSPATSAT